MNEEEGEIPDSHTILLRGGAFTEMGALEAAGAKAYEFSHDSAAYLALSEFGCNGFIELGDKLYIVSSPSKSVDGVDAGMDAYVDALHKSALETLGYAGPRVAVIYPVEDSAAMTLNLNDQIILPGFEPNMNVTPYTAESTVRTTFSIAGEIDNALYKKKGSESAAKSYYNTILGATSSIYQRDFGHSLRSSYSYVWTASDPYCCDSSAALNKFKSNWDSKNGGVSRGAALLLAGRSLGGGLAYVGTLCNKAYGYGVAGDMSGYFPTPVQSYNGQNWDIIVFAHELGHIFGAAHTHELNPPVDKCGSGNCSGARGGTIMSYCHTCSGGVANIDMKFASATINQVKASVGSKSC
jgi:hypothetical protein